MQLLLYSGYMISTMYDMSLLFVVSPLMAGSIRLPARHEECAPALKTFKAKRLTILPLDRAEILF